MMFVESYSASQDQFPNDQEVPKYRPDTKYFAKLRFEYSAK